MPFWESEEILGRKMPAENTDEAFPSVCISLCTGMIRFLSNCAPYPVMGATTKFVYGNLQFVHVLLSLRAFVFILQMWWEYRKTTYRKHTCLCLKFYGKSTAVPLGIRLHILLNFDCSFVSVLIPRLIINHWRTRIINVCTCAGGLLLLYGDPAGTGQYLNGL